MTSDDIIRMAEEAGFPICVGFLGEMMGTFADLVAAHEREQCASVAESYEPTCDTCQSGVANAIRARKKNHG